MRISGKNGALYMGIASSTAVPSPVAFMKTWDLSATTDRYDVTAMGDTNKQYVTGLPDASGKFSGFYDDATPQTYTAAEDGNARKFYLYPNTNNTGQYFFGSGFFDFSASFDVAAGATVSGTWSAASQVQKVG